MNKLITALSLFPFILLICAISLFLDVVFGHEIETKFAQWGPVAWLCETFWEGI